MACEDCGGDLHPCPYEEDVNDNDADTCDCCPDCEDACAQDI